MRTKVYVLFGGKSAEHEVSLKTAQTVIGQLDRDKFAIYPVYITKDGKWILMEGADRSKERLELASAMTEKTRPFEMAVSRTDQAAATIAEQTAIATEIMQRKTLAKTLSDVLRHYADEEGKVVFFPVIHGTYGEDGTLQGLLEMLDVPYVGNGVLSSAAGMDKLVMKTILAQEKIPQVQYTCCYVYEWEVRANKICDHIEHTIGYPCYVKPARMGSSVGINRCMDRGTLRSAIAEAFLYDRKVIVEQEVVGREVQLAVVGNDLPECSVAGEFVRDPSFFDYEKKYLSAPLVQQIPARLSKEMYVQLRSLAVKAFRALDGAGLMRVDFFVTNNNEIYLNEVNTMPGFTEHSMFPTLWQKTTHGTYPQLLEKLIDLALIKHAQKQQIRYESGV